MVYPRIYHVYTRHMREDYIYVVYTRHIPGIYRKSGFQMMVPESHARLSESRSESSGAAAGPWATFRRSLSGHSDRDCWSLVELLRYRLVVCRRRQVTLSAGGQIPVLLTRSLRLGPARQSL
jgi:hypothetical protein